MLHDPAAIDVAEPVGDDELFLLETSLAPARAMVALAERVATVGGHPPDWGQIAAVGLGPLALAIRRAWLGDRISSDGRCPDPNCAERVDVSFSSQTYLAYHQARRPRNVVACEDGWYQLVGTPVRFRIPSVADLLGAGDDPAPVTLLADRCLQPAELPTRNARAVDRALAALAPSLEGVVGGQCPACGTQVALRFDPLTYTILELRDAFAGIYHEIHALAATYGWHEDTILRQPRGRRRRYVAMIDEDRRYHGAQGVTMW